MTDKLKGFLVNFDREIMEDGPEMTAMKMIKGVVNVKGYVAHAEDYMMYETGQMDARKHILSALLEKQDKPTT